jgi:hypothetical protein
LERRRKTAVWAVIAVLAASLMAAAQPPVPAGYAAVDAGQAREMGLAAIRQGRPDIAAEIALALLAQDKTDSFAHFLMANSLMRMNDRNPAERAAKQSYRYAQSPEQSYQSAHLAANLAFQRGALTTSQWWLRKAAEAAPDTARKDETVAQFRAVRARNPWRIALAFSVRPSDNVNNGSSGQYNIIDGLPYVGVLSRDAQAVTGVVADAAISLGYRISQDAQRQTSVGFQLFTRHVRLAPEEKARLGGNPGFGADRMAVSLTHDWRPDGSPHLFSLAGKIGRQSYQNGVDYNFAGLELGHRIAVGAKNVVDSALEAEQRAGQGDRSFGLRSTVVHQRANLDLVTASLLVNRFDTPLTGRSSTMVGAQIGYTLARPLGQVSLSGTLGAQKNRFSTYTLAGLTVPGGRDDITSYGEVQMQFNDLSHSGFAPLLRLRHQRTASNVSRFDPRESSVVLGLASKF